MQVSMGQIWSVFCEAPSGPTEPCAAPFLHLHLHPVTLRRACPLIGDNAIIAVARSCPDLCKLDISGCERVTGVSHQNAPQGVCAGDARERLRISQCRSAPVRQAFRGPGFSDTHGYFRFPRFSHPDFVLERGPMGRSAASGKMGEGPLGNMGISSHFSHVFLPLPPGFSPFLPLVEVVHTLRIVIS